MLTTTKDFELHHAWKCILTDYTRRSITKTSDRLPALAGLASEFGAILLGDRYRFGLWMNDPSSLLWSFHNYKEESNELMNKLPTWSWARYERNISWDYSNAQAMNWEGHILTQCLDVAPSEQSFLELHLRGPLLCPKDDLIPIHRLRRVRYRAYETTKVSGGRACFIEIEDIDLDGYDAISSLRIMPLVKGGNWKNFNDEEDLHTAWGLVLNRELTLGKAKYTRIGTATLNIIDREVEDMFPPLQELLNEEDYLDKDMDGNCTIVVV